MKLDVKVLGVLIVVAAACVLGWPMLSTQESARGMEQAASLPLEKARRLLHQYNTHAAYQAERLEQLRAAGVESRPMDEVSQPAGELFERKHKDWWESFAPLDFTSDPPRPARRVETGLAGRVPEGVRYRASLLNENERLLKEALREVDEALAVTVGDASGRSHAEANRLKAVIQYHSGTTQRMRAGLLRAEAEPYRYQLLSLSQDVVAWQAETNRVAASGVENELKMLREEAARTDANVKEKRQQLAELERTISDLQGRIAQAQRDRDTAAQAIEALKERGIDFTDPRGAEVFSAAMLEQDRRYRRADRLVQALTAGDYPDAEIDASGDYLRGRYLEGGSSVNVRVVVGLRHYEDQRAVLAAGIERAAEGLAALNEDIVRQETTREAYAAIEDQARRRIEQARARAADIHANLNRIESEAFAMEEDAIRSLSASASGARQAAGLAGDWVSQARENAGALSPAARERSAMEHRTRDGWMAAHINAQSADASLAMGWVYYQRYRDHLLTADALAALPDSVRPAEAKVSAEQTKALEARDAGVEAVKQAVAALERAHRDAERHWTLVAQAAGTTYLLALFGDESYTRDAIEAYRSVVEGRDDRAFVEPFVRRLKRLESR